MARPQKTGMDYFPHDTDACNDEKVELLRMLYGNDGYAFYFIMLERIYRTKCGELLVSEEDNFKKLDEEIVIILSKKIQISEEKFKKILKTCLKHKIFSEKKFTQKGVLTSDGIKIRMKPILAKRSNMAKKHSTRKIVSASETQQKLVRKPPETPPETDIEKERKEKEKERKENYTTEIKNFVREFQEAVLENKGKGAPSITESLINNCCDTVDKLIRIDGFTLNEIRETMVWATNDSFWSQHVSSLAPLRKKSGSTGLKKFQNI